MRKKRSHWVSNGLMGIGVLGILDMLASAVLGSGLNLGTYIPGVLGIVLLCYGLWRRSARYAARGKLPRLLEQVGIWMFTFFVLSFLLLSGIIFHASRRTPPNHTDAILVLGAGVKGNKPSAVLTERLKTAIAYVRNHPEDKVILSGGRGPGENIAEAEAMRIYWEKHSDKTASVQLLLENRSTSTYQNLAFSKSLFFKTTGRQLKTAIIVTSDFHQYRAGLLARRQQITPYSLSSPTPFYLYPNVMLREYLAILKTWILG